MMIMTRGTAGLLGFFLAAIPSLALAHTGHGTMSGFADGFMHPVSGLDHVLAMVTVGILAATLGGNRIFAVPTSFLAMMALGGALGLAGLPIPFVELAIALSILVPAAIIALGLSPSLIVVMALVGTFALFHGFAHGAEMPANASGLEYAFGFMAMTAILHGIGIGIQRGLARFGSHLPGRVFGGVIALSGLFFLAGAVQG